MATHYRSTAHPIARDDLHTEGQEKPQEWTMTMIASVAWMQLLP